MQAITPEDVPPIITTPHHYLISIYRNKLFFVAVVQTEGRLEVDSMTVTIIIIH